MVYTQLSNLFSTQRTRLWDYFSNPSIGEFIQVVVFSFIFVCNLVQSGNNVDTTHQDKQDTLSEQEALIEVTGGFLVPNKSVCFFVEYKWHQGKWKCKNLGIQKTLTGKTKEGITFPLRYLKSDEAMIMLGMYLDPYGNNHDQVKYTRKNHSTGKPAYKIEAYKKMGHGMP